MNLEEYRANHRTVTTEHGDFAYLDIGEGPPAVFVHGLFVSSYLWRDAIEAVTDQRRCIAYSLPHHGGSTVPDDQDLSMKAQGEMLGSFIDGLGLDRVDLVGNDTGGGVVQVFAARNPEQVRSIVLTNCEARDVLPSPSDIAKLVSDLAAKGELAPIMVQQAQDYSIARSKVGLGAGFAQPERLTDDDIRGYIEPHQATLESARRLEDFINAMDNADLIEIIPLLERLDAPMLCVWGTADVVFPLELAHWLRDTFPGCEEVVEVDGGELFWPGERPGELVAPLRRFWSETVDRAEAAAA